MKTTKHNITNTAEPIKPGYKKTKVGVIPEDWEVKRFESITQDKGLIRGPFGGTLKKEIFVESGYKVYEQQNAIYKSSELGEYYITEEKFKELERFSVQIDNFIVSCSGTIGRIYRIPENFQKGIINQALLLIKINPKVIKYDFFNYIFESEVIQRKILEVQGGAMKNLVGMSEIRKVKFPIPPLPEQKAIADCLSTWDKGIEKLSALIASKKEQKKGLMQGLFSGKLKVENGELIQAKEGENFLKDWKKVKFNDLFQRVNSKKHQITSKEYLERGQYPIVDQGKLNIVGFSNQEDKLYQNIPVIVFGDHTREIKLIDFNFIIGADGTQLLKNNGKDNISFLYYLLKNTHIPNLGYSRHMRVLITKKFIIPNLSEQNAIAEVLITADKEIELLEKKLEAFKTQKKGLMQVLLTGTKRLVES